MKNLTIRQKEIYDLYFNQKKKQEEIATLLKISQAAVSKLVRKIKYKLPIENKKNIVKYCLFCKRVKPLEIHHIIPKEINNTIEKTIYLCSNCHSLIHSEIYKVIFSQETGVYIKGFT